MIVERDPCTCEACVLAGVSKRPQRRDWLTKEWLHGRELANWWRARDAFMAQTKAFRIKEMK